MQIQALKGCKSIRLNPSLSPFYVQLTGRFPSGFKYRSPPLLFTGLQWQKEDCCSSKNYNIAVSLICIQCALVGVDFGIFGFSISNNLIV
jgi:hypothetical protein